MVAQIKFQEVAKWQGDRLLMIIGLVASPEVAKLMDHAWLNPNSGNPNVNTITKCGFQYLCDYLGSLSR